MKIIYAILIAFLLAPTCTLAQYDLQVIAIHNSTPDSLYMKTGVSDTLWRKTNGVYNTAYVAKQWAYFPFFQPIDPPTTLAGYGITDGVTTAVASSTYAVVNHNHSGIYQLAGNYALASHNHDGTYATTGHDHTGVYQPIGSYLVAADIVDKASISSPAFTGTPTGIGLPVYAQVAGSNATTTGQALTNISRLSVPCSANAVYEFEAVMSCQTSAVTTGTAYGVQYSAAGASVEAHITGSSTATATATKTLRISALNSATALYLAGSGQTGGILIKGRLTTGANAGNLTIQHLKLTSGTSTVFIGSFLKVTRIS